MSVPLQEWMGAIPWLQGLPEAWRVAPFKSVAALSTADNATHDDRLLSLSTSRGIVPKHYDDENRVRTGEDLRRYWRVRPGHVVVNPMWLAHGSVAASTIEGVISPDYRVYDTAPFIDPRYLALLLRTHEYRRLYDLFVRGNTTYDRRVSKDDFHSIPVVTPPLERQQAIVAFLDRKTAAVDRLIAKKERLIELLQEKRQALITQAVTEGLDPSVPMKDSGLPALGSIPATWTRTKMRRVCASLRDGTHTPPPREEGEFRLLSARNIKDGRLVLLDDDRTLGEKAFRELERSYQVRPGDVVVTIVGATTGNCGIVYADIIKSSAQRSVAILRPHTKMLSAEYLHLWITGDPLQATIQGIVGKYAAQPGIYLDEFANLPVLLPPLVEQNKILAAVMPRLAALRTICTTIERHLELLRDFRQALITNAVTGKIDVSKEAA